MTEVLVVLCTFPDLPKARQIGTALVEKQLAACVNLLPGTESIFRWDGEISMESVRGGSPTHFRHLSGPRSGGGQAEGLVRGALVAGPGD